MSRLTQSEITAARPSRTGVRVSLRVGTLADPQYVVACGSCDYVELIRHSPKAAAEELALYHRHKHRRSPPAAT